MCMCHFLVFSVGHICCNALTKMENVVVSTVLALITKQLQLVEWLCVSFDKNSFVFQCIVLSPVVLDEFLTLSAYVRKGYCSHFVCRLSFSVGF